MPFFLILYSPFISSLIFSAGFYLLARRKQVNGIWTFAFGIYCYIVLLLAKEGNWNLFLGLAIPFLILAFTSFSCPNCKNPVSGTDAQKKNCPRCGMWGEFEKANEQGGRFLKMAEAGDVEEVNQLISEGVNINFADKHGDTALMRAAFWGNNQVVAVLIRERADIDSKGKYGSTPLMWAAHEGKSETVKLLIAAGANLNIVNDKGWTALRIAKWKKHFEVIQILKEAGA